MIALNWTVYHLAKVLLWVFLHVRFSIAIEGRENIPVRGGYIFVSNHLSWIETVLIPVSIRTQMAPMAKRELLEVPGLGQFLVAIGTIPVVRDRPTFAEMKELQRQSEKALGRGLVLGLFPEGTRSRDGRLGQFHDGAAFIAATTGRMVVPAGVSYSKGVFGRRRIRLAIGAPIDPVNYRQKADLTTELRRQVSALSGQELV